MIPLLLVDILAYLLCPARILCDTSNDGCFVPAAQRLQETRGQWFNPVLPGLLDVSDSDLLMLPVLVWFRVHRGIDFLNLCLLDCAVPLASENYTLGFYVSDGNRAPYW